MTISFKNNSEIKTFIHIKAKKLIISVETFFLYFVCDDYIYSNVIICLQNLIIKKLTYILYILAFLHFVSLILIFIAFYGLIGL